MFNLCKSDTNVLLLGIVAKVFEKAIEYVNDSVMYPNLTLVPPIEKIGDDVLV